MIRVLVLGCWPLLRHTGFAIFLASFLTLCHRVRATVSENSVNELFDGLGLQELYQAGTQYSVVR